MHAQMASAAGMMPSQQHCIQGLARAAVSRGGATVHDQGVRRRNLLPHGGAPRGVPAHAPARRREGTSHALCRLLPALSRQLSGRLQHQILAAASAAPWSVAR